jgi:hypothetical protein
MDVMALTDTKVRQVKHSGRPAGDKHSDGGGLHLHVTGAGKYWRVAYRFAGKQKKLSLGVYPAVSLVQARKGRDKAKELLAQGIDPSAAKRQAKQDAAVMAANTFEVVARDWLNKTAANRKPSTQERAQRWIERAIVPHIGKLPIATIGPRDLLEQVLRKV